MFHANMLRKYHIRKTVEQGMVFMCGYRHLEITNVGESADEVSVSSIEEDNDRVKENDDIKYCQLRDTQTWEDVKISKDLTEEQRHEVRELLEEYSDVLTDIPGKTDLLECAIDLIDDEPFRVRA